MSKTTNLFEVDDIPLSLWNPQHCHNSKAPPGLLRLPGQLEEAYRNAISDHNLGALAGSKDEGTGPVGGKSEEEVHEHFAKRFAGSCGRVQLFSLDPHQTFQSTRSALARVFSGGKVRLLDFPIGAGAAALTIISIVSTLRSEDAAVFPRVDLEVEVVGGDNSKLQIDLASEMFSRLQTGWLENGVLATLEAHEWDVTDDESTDAFLDHWKEGLGNGVTPAMVVSNFSGFLGSPVKDGDARIWFDEAESSLRHIFASASNLKANSFWIEPAQPQSRKKLFPRLRTKVLNKLVKTQPVLNNEPQSVALTHHPLPGLDSFITRAVGIHCKNHETAEDSNLSS